MRLFGKKLFEKSTIDKRLINQNLTQNQQKTLRYLLEKENATRQNRINQIKLLAEKRKNIAPKDIPDIKDKNITDWKPIEASFVITIGELKKYFEEYSKKSNPKENSKKLNFGDSISLNFHQEEIANAWKNESNKNTVQVKKSEVGKVELSLPVKISAPTLENLSHRQQGDASFSLRNDIELRNTENNSWWNTEQNTLSGNTSLLSYKGPQIDDVAWHDFSEYEMFISPDYVDHKVNNASYSPSMLQMAADLEQQKIDSGEVLAFLNEFRRRLSVRMRFEALYVYSEGVSSEQIIGIVVEKYVAAIQNDTRLLANMLSSYWDFQDQNISSWQPNHPADLEAKVRLRHSLISDLVYKLNKNYFMDIYFSRMSELEIQEEIIYAYNFALRRASRGDLLDFGQYTPEEIADEVDSPDSASIGWPFSIYTSGSINIGLRSVYRQEWRQLGYQPGEVIKTIPLGPGEVQKVSAKIVKKNKISRTSEHLTSTEITSETADTTKDSSEVVKEATSNFKWHAEAEGSVSNGFASGKIKAGASGGNEKKARNTSNALSESVQKTASKIRKETKVIVSSEKEEEFEYDSSSEIRNPNEEKSLTYIYSKIQMQYDVFTALAEIQDVIMIAEPVPEPRQVTVSWIKRYSWIIAKVLLDDSFRDVLSDLHNYMDLADNTAFVDELKNTKDTSLEHLEKVANNPGGLGLNQIDISQQSQSSYVEAMKSERENQRQSRLTSVKRERLIQHIIDNILHYCRAIWEQEDPQQRILRYRQLGIRMPSRYSFNGRPINELLDQINAQSNDDEEITLNGTFTPIFDDSDDAIYVSDIIDPKGPIGFVGNYSVFTIKPEKLVGESRLLFDILKQDYLPDEDSPEEEFESTNLVDPVLKGIRRRIASQSSNQYGFGQWTVDEDTTMDPASSDDPASGETDGNGGGLPETSQEDSEASSINRIRTFSQQAKVEMTQIVPKLRSKIASLVFYSNEEKANMIDLVNSIDDSLFEKYEAEAIQRKEMSRRTVVESNNLMIDLLLGSGTALEEFKMEHRKIDVMKAEEELKQIDLENKRRQELIKQGLLGDPDIEKLTVVAGGEINKRLLEAGVLDEIQD